MKAKRITAAQSVNPLFDATASRLARKRGLSYEEPGFLNHEIGEIVDDPHAWRLCTFDKPVAVPADDECKSKVASFLNTPKRRKFLRGLLKWHNNPTLVNQLGAVGQKYIQHMLDAYRNQLDELANATAAAVSEEE